MPHEFPNDLSFRNLGNFRIISNLHENYNLVRIHPPEKKILLTLAKESLKIEIELFSYALFHMETRVFLKYFARGCSLNLQLFENHHHMILYKLEKQELSFFWNLDIISNKSNCLHKFWKISKCLSFYFHRSPNPNFFFFFNSRTLQKLQEIILKNTSFNKIYIKSHFKKCAKLKLPKLLR